MDAMSTVPGISSSCKTNQGSSGKPDDDARFPGTSRDCPVFYMRKKAQKDVEDAVAMLERFDHELW